MPKKIVIIEVVEHVYIPDLNDPENVYAENDIETIEDALKFDKTDVDNGDTQTHELADETTVVARKWRIIEEP